MVTDVDAFTHANALSTLLTTESLLFAAIAAALSFANVTNRVPDLPLEPRTLGYIAAGLLTAVAIGAVAAWWAIFASPWSCSFVRTTEAVAILIGIVAQPILALFLARGLRARQ